MKSATITAPEGRHRLRDWLDRTRLTQEQAAARIGIHRVHLNQFLTGERRPGLDTAILIEDATGISVRTWQHPRFRPGGSAEPSTPSTYVNQRDGQGRLDLVNNSRASRTQTPRQSRITRKSSKCLQGDRRG